MFRSDRGFRLLRIALVFRAPPRNSASIPIALKTWTLLHDTPRAYCILHDFPIILSTNCAGTLSAISKARKPKKTKTNMKNPINSLCLLLCLGLSTAVVTTLTGCNNNNESAANPPTAGQVIDDKTLTANVKAALSQSPDYKFSDVTVDTMNGTVQLSGFVNTSDQKSKAVDIAKGVQGVKDVEDKMTTKPAQ
jgi:hypothetical protein